MTSCEEVLLDTIPSGARAELHGRVGESIERLAGWTSHDHLDEIAVHYSEAARLGQVEQAVESAFGRRTGRERCWPTTGG